MIPKGFKAVRFLDGPRAGEVCAIPEEHNKIACNVDEPLSMLRPVPFDEIVLPRILVYHVIPAPLGIVESWVATIDPVGRQRAIDNAPVRATN